MFIRLFKENQPASVFILLPLFGLLLWIPSFVINPPIEEAFYMPFYRTLADLANSNVVLSRSLAFASVVIQGIMLNTIINGLEVLPKKTNYTAFFYVLLMSSMAKFNYLNPLLMGNFFLLFVFRRIFTIYRESTVYSVAYDSGALIALGSLFYFPVIFTFPFVLITFLISRPFVWREYVIATLGLITPYLFVFTWYFVTDKLPQFWEEISGFSSKFRFLNLSEFSNLQWLAMFVIGVLVIVSVNATFDTIESAAARVKNYLTSLAGFLIIAVILALFSGDQPGFSMLIIALPLSVLLANYLYDIRRKWVVELTGIAVVALILMQYLV